MATLSDFTKKIQTEKLTVDYRGGTIDFNVRPIMANHQEMIIQKTGDLFKIYARNNPNGKAKSKDSKDKFMDVTGEEFRQMSTRERLLALYSLCDEDGNLLYKTYENMTSSIPDDLLTLIVAKIIEHTGHESTEDAEKN